MKKWQMATAAAVLLAGLGSVAGVAFATTPHAAGAGTGPSIIVQANPHWVPPPSGYTPPAQRAAVPSLPAASGTILLQTDFQSGDNSAWHSPLLPNSDATPLWQARNGVLQQVGDTTLNNVNEEAYYLTGQPTWSNLIVDASVLATSGEGAGLVWNAQNAS
ncbi:MAG TPA: hypothetical protein VKY74_18045, partial [Chloroflexia bacterium]|nr:hypothetical protein [Chloroflexia bacterium]